ncbi:hypothetical protein cyc_06423 [Cyclospora cayetanensis]|uniref:Uncharacterized protein n=1 Tax=Cyclospora cayetanensis TaxID=88456 RepID=A0A1D3CSZ5_9EIME|nr:hypothetical protein cyc_06423 [Cyclospora cayetanensis]
MPQEDRAEGSLDFFQQIAEGTTLQQQPTRQRGQSKAEQQALTEAAKRPLCAGRCGRQQQARKVSAAIIPHSAGSPGLLMQNVFSIRRQQQQLPQPAGDECAAVTFAAERRLSRGGVSTRRRLSLCGGEEVSASPESHERHVGAAWGMPSRQAAALKCLQGLGTSLRNQRRVHE